LRAFSRGGNQENLNLQIIKDFEIPVPPLSSQEEFSISVEKVRTIKNEQATSRSRLDDLFQSLLDKAFKGEL